MLSDHMPNFGCSECAGSVSVPVGSQWRRIAERPRSASYNMKLRFKLRPVHLLAWALCLFLLVGVVLRPRPQVAGLAINFVGFTNAFGEPQCAVFLVTNHSHRRIAFIIPEPQIRIGPAWTDVVPGTNPLSRTLAGGLGTNITLALPKSGDAWRMPIIWVSEPGTAEFYLRRGKNFLRGLREGSLSGWKYGSALTGYTNFSAEIELTKGEPDGVANRSQPVGQKRSRTPPAAGSGR